jgi:hypothetical protein
MELRRMARANTSVEVLKLSYYYDDDDDDHCYMN